MKFIRSASLTSAGCVLLSFAGTAYGELIDRGGGLIFDSDRNITWLANTNHGAGSAYDDGFLNTDGKMTWQSAMDWAASLSYYDSVRDVTYDDWHLPTTLQPDPSCSDQNPAFSSGTGCTGSDLGHMFYTELGGTAFTSILDSNDPDLALFSNVSGDDGYWSETSYDATNAHVFNYGYGLQAPDQKILGYFAWAVRDGDVGGSSGGCNAVNGTAGDDTLEGTPQEDCINGKAGADSMSGLAGDDIYTVDNVGDTVIEGAGEGTDTIKASVTYTLPIYVENITLTGTGAINANGNGLANKLNGNSGNNRLDGKGGADIMAGKAGNDYYYVNASGDVVTEGVDQGIDTVRSTVTHALRSNVEKLVLAGTSPVNGTGNTLANTITGNGANNTLNGKEGNDTLKGSAGADKFLFNTTLNASTNVDKITDFIPADDTIVLESWQVFSALIKGTLPASAFAIGTTATTAAHRIIYDPATGNIRYDADGTGPIAAVRFAQLTTKPALTNADFFVQCSRCVIP